MQEILRQLKIDAEVVHTEHNEVMSKYYLRLKNGTRVSKIERCATEIALGIRAYSKPILQVIPQDGLISLELLMNPLKDIRFSSLANTFRKTSSDVKLPLLLGVGHNGKNIIPDLSKMPHLLIAGTTGSGKSVMLHSIINGLIENTNIRLALIDPKKVELSYYQNIRHLLYPIAVDADSAMDILSDLVDEMEFRFYKMQNKSVNSIDNMKGMPYIVLVIDEFSDLMYTSKKNFQKYICMLAQKSRACGIHIVIATQRPSAEVVTGLIKANFPSRISCMVTSLVDSRVILDSGGAEKLLGAGDALIKAPGYNMVRFQGAYISNEEVVGRCQLYERTKFSKIKNFFKRLAR